MVIGTRSKGPEGVGITGPGPGTRRFPHGPAPVDDLPWQIEAAVETPYSERDV
jgi:hypothetical protein